MCPVNIFKQAKVFAQPSVTVGTDVYADTEADDATANSAATFVTFATFATFA